MEIKQISKEIHKNAIAHGWWDEERTFPELLCLVHSEVSEALEDYRNGLPIDKIVYGENGKVNGIPSELADIVIRVFDVCEHYGIDIEKVILEKHEFNKTRPYKHGGKVL